MQNKKCTLSNKENLGEGIGFPMKKKWRDDFLSNEIPISPSSPLSKCSPSPWNSLGALRDKGDEMVHLKSGASNVAMPSRERATLRLLRDGWACTASCPLGNSMRGASRSPYIADIHDEPSLKLGNFIEKFGSPSYKINKLDTGTLLLYLNFYGFFW